MTLAERIADALMTDSSGQKATRMQMMQAPFPGAVEHNMGGRNRESVIRTIQEVLDAEQKTAQQKPHIHIGLIGGAPKLSSLMTGLLACAPTMGSRPEPKDADYYLETIRSSIAAGNRMTATQLLMDVMAQQAIPSLPRWLINGHVLLTPKTCTFKHSDDTACLVCDAGLAVCALCGDGESGLEQPCRSLVGAFDNTRANSEGWAIFNQSEIQRVDDTGEFESDAEAIAFVRKQANDGSNYHKLALALTNNCEPASDSNGVESRSVS